MLSVSRSKAGIGESRVHHGSGNIIPFENCPKLNYRTIDNGDILREFLEINAFVP